jgi:3-phosphoglycerate kinase
MKTIKDIQVLKGVRVLLRADFNVPVQNGVVVDDFRIRKILPTLAYLKEKGARTILISHIENNDSSADASGKKPGEPTLSPIIDALKKLGVDCAFVPNYSNAFAASQAIVDGGFVLLENLRVNPGEKKNDPKFAKELASLADVYINDAFSVSHRAHASIVAITEFMPSYAGFLLESEVTHLSAAFHPARPFFFILGGAKFETKVPLIEKFIQTADFVFVGGALAHNFFKEKGYNLGKSLIFEQDFNLKRFFDNPKLLLPLDVVVVNAAGEKNIKKPDQLGADDVIMDAGPASVALLQKTIAGSGQILWNGPLGAYEKGFKQPTIDLAKTVAAATAGTGTANGKKVQTIVGGADTLATIAEIRDLTGEPIEDEFSFVSTGGGAMLDFLANETLPGIEALNSSKS